jgi:hypothetical protein
VILVSLTGDAGQKDDALRIDSAQSGKGNLTVYAANITLQETDGDLTILKVLGTGDVNLDVPKGSIDDLHDTVMDDVAQMQQMADTLKNRVTTANAAAESKRLIAESLKTSAELAQQKLLEMAKLSAEITAIETQLLRDTDRELLAMGIPVPDGAELLQLLEDLGS